MKKIYLSLSILLSSIVFSQNMQTAGAIQIKTPQSYAFEKYGNVPINLYTGTLDLKVPIFSLPTSNGTNIDIFVSYDSSGFLPHKKSDYAGTGWSLLAGGRITRTLNRAPDEYQGNPTANGGLFDLGPDLHGFLTGVRLNSFTNNQTVYDLYSGVGGTTALNWRLGSVQNGYEGTPDVFHFNAMGLSGKFMIGNDGNVLVESNDPNMKVDLSGLVSYGGKQFCKPPTQTIVITDGQGNKYYFGGDFSKYEIGYLLKSPGLDKDNRFEGLPYISSFSLAKVEFINGQTITLGYVQDTLNNIFCNLTTSSINLKVNAKVLNFDGYFQDGTSSWEWQLCPGGLAGCTNLSANVPSDTENFVLTKRSLLESIKYEDKEIRINYKDAGYPIKHYEGVSNTLDFNEFLVDNIQVFANNNMIQNTVFAYDDLGGMNKRPFLKTITESQSNKVYNFEYYNTSNLPKYITKGLDHWGYWNGNDTNVSLAPFDTYNAATGDYTLNNTFRDTNVQKYNIGLLSKITYPTKGYSIFEYEPNYYGRRVERNSASAFLPTLTNNAGVVGGARIHRQYDYSENGGIINNKTYQYATTLNGNTSSGILMNWPRYMYYIEFSGPGYFEKRMLRSSSNVQQNSMDSYNVGYQKVYEINAGKGYTEYNFTNYEDYPDILNPDTGNIRNYFNNPPNQGTYQSSPENLYKNFRNLYGIDRSILRGKLKSEIIYPEGSSNPLKKTEYEYNDNIDYNPNTFKDNNNYVTINHLSGYWVQGYKRYLNTSALKKKIITDFLNNNPIKNTTDYSYNSSNHLNLVKENTILSDNSELSKSYSYAQDINIGNTLMTSKNMVGIPTITEAKKDSKILSKTEIIYPTTLPTSQTGNLVLPLSTKSYDLQNPTSATTEVTYDLYDSKGNLQQYTTKDGVPVAIIWGYNQTQPIAKIEGATYTQVQSLASAIITASNTDALAGRNNDETTFLDALKTFRNSLSNYQITTYTFDPLIGVRSITPPSGIREVYLYDTANRLMEIRENDQAGKLLKEFKYNYKN
ncbi:hypothetical protein [Chryseobacterium sp. JUb7]|uniref:hypothetical protein n=1 Tax=Chryseobacterium sp. JUb7 TaxID=2940599 RepID=UPI0021693E21|nr:hypothetical protein [Chryseobacterium sp. JUb7]MCS3533056.1 hypothetical protein [Chryseobacterium sp. JUb7]